MGYTDDQWSATVGVGRKFNEKWAGNVSVGWDSGAGNPLFNFRSNWRLLECWPRSAQFSPAANYFIAGGVKYFWLGDVKAQPASMFGRKLVAQFEDNHALGYGLKMGYRF